MKLLQEIPLPVCLCLPPFLYRFVPRGDYSLDRLFWTSSVLRPSDHFVSHPCSCDSQIRLLLSKSLYSHCKVIVQSLFSHCTVIVLLQLTVWCFLISEWCCRSHWPRGLRRKSTTARLLRSWVRDGVTLWVNTMFTSVVNESITQ
jgi:hypothetical protein